MKINEREKPKPGAQDVWCTLIEHYCDKNSILTCKRTQTAERLKALRKLLSRKFPESANLPVNSKPEEPIQFLSKENSSSRVGTEAECFCERNDCSCNGTQTQSDGNSKKDFQMVFKRGEEIGNSKKEFQYLSSEKWGSSESLISDETCGDFTYLAITGKQVKSSPDPDSMPAIAAIDMDILKKLENLIERERTLKHDIQKLEDFERNLIEISKRKGIDLNSEDLVTKCHSRCKNICGDVVYSNSYLFDKVEHLEICNTNMIQIVLMTQREKNCLLRQIEHLKSKLKFAKEKVAIDECESFAVNKNQFLEDHFDGCNQNCACICREIEEFKSTKKSSVSRMDVAVSTGIVEEFEDVLKNCQTDGLPELVAPVKEVTRKLKKLVFSHSSECCSDEGLDFLEKSTVPCNCAKLGPDALGLSGEWICLDCDGELFWGENSSSSKILQKSTVQISSNTETDPHCFCGCNIKSTTNDCSCSETKSQVFHDFTQGNVGNETLRCATAAEKCFQARGGFEIHDGSMREEKICNDSVDVCRKGLEYETRECLTKNMKESNEKLIYNCFLQEKVEEGTHECDCGYESKEAARCSRRKPSTENPCLSLCSEIGSCRSFNKLSTTHKNVLQDSSKISNSCKDNSDHPGDPCQECQKEFNQNFAEVPIKDQSTNDPQTEVRSNECNIASNPGNDIDLTALCQLCYESELKKNFDAAKMVKIESDDKSNLCPCSCGLLMEEIKEDIPRNCDPQVQGMEIPRPTDFKVVQKIYNSLLVTWRSPEHLTFVAGYEIYINGLVCFPLGRLLAVKIRRATRTEALINILDVSTDNLLKLHSVGTNGFLSEPVYLNYPSCNCCTA